MYALDLPFSDVSEPPGAYRGTIPYRAFDSSVIHAFSPTLGQSRHALMNLNVAFLDAIDTEQRNHALYLAVSHQYR